MDPVDGTPQCVYICLHSYLLVGAYVGRNDIVKESLCLLNPFDHSW